MTPDTSPTLADIEAAASRIAGISVRTPLVPAPRLGDGVHMKLECVQPTGSFKVRGAASRILALDAGARARGVVTASTGNHGRAVAYVASRLGIPAAVCISEAVPPGKVAALRELGCELIVEGASQTIALENAARLVEERGMTLIHPFDDPWVIAGQGTIGLEIADELPSVAAVVVPLSGGGLLAGVATALDALVPLARVIGVSMARAAVMAASLEAGAPVELDERPTLADSLQGGIGLANRHTFRIVRDLVDAVVRVDEPAIWAGMRYALEHHRLVLEGGAAVGIAAVLTGAVADEGDTVIVCSGANVEAHHLTDLADELARQADAASRSPD